MQSPLIEPAELAERMRRPGCVVVDCRFDLQAPDAGRQAYRAGHIPGARYADLDRDLAAPPSAGQGRHPLPDPLVLAGRLGEWGISNGSDVIVYDDSGGALAARLWWMLRWLGHANVAVLNGGIDAWLAQGYPLDTDEPPVDRANFVPLRVEQHWVLETAEIVDFLQHGGLLLDARGGARYRGEQEPIDPVAGHVPGALNLPFSELLDDDGRFLPATVLRGSLVRRIGAREPMRVATMCGSGVTACHLLLAMEIAGVGPGRLYAGSWSEWIRDPGRPVAVGGAP